MKKMVREDGEEVVKGLGFQCFSTKKGGDTYFLSIYICIYAKSDLLCYWILSKRQKAHCLDTQILLVLRSCKPCDRGYYFAGTTSFTC